MGWREDLLPASFAGQNFFYTQISIKGGVRNVQHHFPKRDGGFAEEFGSKLRQNGVEGYFLGEDHHQQAMAFIARLERGAGLLQMPLYGQAQVVCDEFELTETSTEGRFSKVTLKFNAVSGNSGGISINFLGQLAGLVGAAMATARIFGAGRF